MSNIDRQGKIPKILANISPPVCAACQYGKAKKKSPQDGQLGHKNCSIPGDLVHIDQSESSTPGRPLTFSGKNTKIKIHIITIFVDQASKNFL